MKKQLTPIILAGAGVVFLLVHLYLFLYGKPSSRTAPSGETAAPTVESALESTTYGQGFINARYTLGTEAAPQDVTALPGIDCVRLLPDGRVYVEVQNLKLGATGGQRLSAVGRVLRPGETLLLAESSGIDVLPLVTEPGAFTGYRWQMTLLRVERESGRALFRAEWTYSVGQDLAVLDAYGKSLLNKGHPPAHPTEHDTRHLRAPAYGKMLWEE